MWFCFRVVQTLDTPSSLPPSNGFICTNYGLISPKWTHLPYDNAAFIETFRICVKYWLQSHLLRGESIQEGTDLGGLVFMGGAFWLFWPLSLQVRPNDGVEGHCPPHARA